MALGGGTFTVQNKELPGAYINFVSAANANAALSDRGIATMPLELDWGRDGEVFEVTSGDFQKNSLKIFGYEYTSPKLKGLRDLFLNAKTLYAYKLTSSGKKAANELAEAVCCGVRGNDIKIVVQANADDGTMFDVKTLVDTAVVDEQTVRSAADLADNDFVKFKSTAELALTAGSPLAGGENGEVNGAAYQAYLDKIEAYTFNTMGAAVTDETVKGLFNSFVKRMRDEIGVKFQLVLYRCSADYYGTVSVKNKALDEDGSEASLVYWVTGASAGCEVNRSNQNKIYNGEFKVDTDYTQNELKKAISSGEFVFHRVGESVRVLEDINTMITVSDTQGDIFKDNQTVRVMDQIANDIAVIFNTKYLGTVPNDKAGRVSLWSDIVKHHKQLQDIRAIEDFSEKDVTVAQGDTKKSVVVTDCVTAVNAMSKLYMTVTVA
ncbi:MAG: phage tail sheath family protein [Firmicutes bacterium]|nr:phage tail sheath family protein [[Eubacterium] siraeum]MCM1488581.1 phage tail sheath family protein [Bacillota bacterium]